MDYPLSYITCFPRLASFQDYHLSWIIHSRSLPALLDYVLCLITQILD